MTEYDIQPPTLCCAQSGRELKPGETYYSVLRLSPEGFTREDFSVEAWGQPPEDAIACWRSKVPDERGQDQPRTVDVSVLVDVFDGLCGELDEPKRNIRYILALLLVRKKVLKLVDIRWEDGCEVLVLRGPRTDQQYVVKDPGLTESQFAAVEAQFSEILQSPVG